MGKKHIGNLIVTGNGVSLEIINEGDFLTRIFVCVKDQAKEGVEVNMSYALISVGSEVRIKEASQTTYKRRVVSSYMKIENS